MAGSRLAQPRFPERQRLREVYGCCLCRNPPVRSESRRIIVGPHPAGSAQDLSRTSIFPCLGNVMPHRLRNGRITWNLESPMLQLHNTTTPTAATARSQCRDPAPTPAGFRSSNTPRSRGLRSSPKGRACYPLARTTATGSRQPPAGFQAAIDRTKACLRYAASQRTCAATRSI